MKSLTEQITEQLNKQSAEAKIKDAIQSINEVFSNWSNDKGEDIYENMLTDWTYELLDAIYVNGENVAALNDIENWLEEQK